MTPIPLSFLRTDRPALAAMVHAGALPGSPASAEPVHRLASQAAYEARLLADAGVDALVVENMHDTPYLRAPLGPESVAAMTAILLAVRYAAPDTPLGVQILAGANREAMAAAHAAGADFIRAEGFVFAHVGDEGTHEACAGDLLRYRRAIGAGRIAILADIKKKHSAHAITADVDIAGTAKAAEFFRADGVIVTGAATGEPASPGEVAAVKSAVAIPVCVGSGVAPETARDFAMADLLIVGSWFKRGGDWRQPPDEARVGALVDAVRAIRRPAP